MQLFSIPLKSFTFSSLAFFIAPLVSQAVPPVVSNVTIAQRAGSSILDIYYDVSDSDSSSLFITVEISSNGGLSWNVPARTFLPGSHVHAGVNPGTGRHIAWDGYNDWAGNTTAQLRVRVTADDGDNGPGTVGTAFALIPAGSFSMGDAFSEGGSDERPVHTVSLSAYYLGKTEVTWAEWKEVRTWGLANGYTIGAGSGKGESHPVHSVTWYDVVKWCNARSEREGLRPVYYTDDSRTTVYRIYTVDLVPGAIDWAANGYRLPTEAEWEYAARGGLSGKRFPWTVLTIDHTKANYQAESNPTYTYDLSKGLGYHDAWESGSQPYTSVVGAFLANGYGLYDMAGNVWEWCADWYGSSYYSTSAESNPRGPTSGSYRVNRGGSWYLYAYYARVAFRNYGTPSHAYDPLGFRLARSSP